MNKRTQTKNREIQTGCRAIFVGFCETQSAAYVAAASEYLFEQAESAKADQEQREFFEARQFIESNTGKLQKYFENNVKINFKESFSGKTKTLDKDGADFLVDNEKELSLVDDAEMEITVAINSMSHRVESECADELFGLAQRMAMLNQGIKLNEETSPYSPKFFCQTFCQFIAAEKLEQPIKLLILKLFDRHFMRSLAELYAEVNRYLVSANVLPNLRYKAQGMVKKRRRKTDQNVAESEERQSELYKSLESIINGPAMPIDPAQPAMSLEQALNEISAMQRNQNTVSQGDLFSQISAPTFPNTNTAPLQQALECVSMLFDFVKSENTLGEPVKNLVSHLHTPYAKLALSDPTFLADPNHDARQLFNSIVNASEQWTDTETDSSSELVQRIKTVVERILSEGNDSQKVEMAVFGELLTEFTSYIDAFERKIRLTEQRNIQAAEGREKLKEYQLKVDGFIKDKIEPESLPKPVQTLISDVWSSFLTYTLLRHGENSSAWKDAVKVVDTLLWYIEPKTSDDETKMANNIRTDLYASLEDGMKSVGLDASEIKAKLNSLDLCRKLATENASSLTKTTAKNTALEKQAEPTPLKENDHSIVSTQSVPKQAPKNRIQQQKKAIEKPEKDTISNEINQQKSSESTNIQTANSEAEIHTPQPINDTEPSDLLGKLANSLDSKKTSSAIKQKKQASRKEIENVLSLKFGTWLDWHKPGEKQQQVKLTWYNTRTQNCMLSNNRGKEIAVVTANTIALGIHDGWITVIDKKQKKPLFERMLETTLGNMSNSNQRMQQTHFNSK